MKKSVISMVKKGATLIELTIVLAIVSILSAVIVTFTASVQNYSRAFDGTYNSYSDFDSVRLGFQKWLTHFDSTEYGLSLDEEKTRLIAKQIDNLNITYSLTFLADENTFIGYYPENDDLNDYKKTVYYFGTTKTVKSVYFNIYDNEDKDGCLVECAINYDRYNISGTEEYIKTINFVQNMFAAEKLS